MKKKYWLALWWGSARWFVHIWVLKYLEEKNIEIWEITCIITNKVLFLLWIKPVYMALLEAIFLLTTLILMPFITYGKPWSLKLLYLGFCGFFTPIIWIPLYYYLMK